MSWRDWKARDVLAGLGAGALGLATVAGGDALSNRLLSMLGASEPDNFDAPDDVSGLTLGMFVTLSSGLALAYIFLVQVRAGRAPRGLLYGLVITSVSIATATPLDALLWMQNVFITLALLPLTLLHLALTFGAWRHWFARNNWVLGELNGRHERQRLKGPGRQ